MSSELVGEADFSWVIATELEPTATLLSPALLDKYPVVTLPIGAGTSNILDEWLSASRQPSFQRLICNNWGAIAGLAAEGVGLGMLPTSWATVFEQRGQLRILQSKPALQPLAYSFQWRSDDNRPLLASMREIVHLAVDFSITHRLM